MKLPMRQLAVATALAFTLPATAQSCTGDILADGVINGADLGAMLSYWGPRTTAPFSVASDLNGDGVINGGDLGLLLSNWGPCPASISSVTPTEGCFVGGTAITITGAYLGTATEVTIGGMPATNVTVNSPTTVTATTPAGILGPATVLVTTAAGTYTAPQTFTYMPASVSSIVPNAGVVTGGASITITGAYLALTTGVTIGGAAATNVTLVSSTTLTAIAPPGQVGNADVVITGSKGTIIVPGGFQYVSTPGWATLIEGLPDAAVITDAATRAAITATGLAWHVRDTASQIEMVLVPQGTFIMGCTGSNVHSCAADENPTHSVTRTQPFYMGRYEVTQAQWIAKMGSNPSYHQGAGYPDAANRPVEQVSWTTVQGFLTATNMRLPSEAEWEYACRAGTDTAYNNGSSDVSTVGAIAWYSATAYYQTHTVGGLEANAFGLYDMAGNVFEWTNDLYSSTYYESSPTTNPPGPVSGAFHVLRGGSWSTNYYYVRSSCRNGPTPGDSGSATGFRVARNP
jgi:formylglycine-generating enzyme required for sulfatase activity